MNLEATKMKSVIEGILRSHGLFEKFAEETDFHVKIGNEPYMPLSIEKHDRQVVVAHNFIQNGDLIPDPDMKFCIESSGAWSPVALQLATGHYVRCAVGSTVNRRKRGELARFSTTWAENLVWQRFASGTLISASCED